MRIAASVKAVARSLIVGTLWVVFNACAQAAPPRIADEYTVRRWGVEDGLPEGIVTAVAQFSDGFLWLTTPRHVVRFDGVEFVPYPQKAYPAEKPKRFNGILRDRRGTVWVSGEDGVMRHDGSGWKTVPLLGDIDRQQGEVWRVETPDGLIEQAPHLVVFWVQETPEGTLWVASNAGMFRFDGQALNFVSQGVAGRVGAFTSASMDVSGRIWLVGQGRLFSFDGTTYAPADFPSGAGREALFQVFAGIGDTVWGKRLDGRLFKRCGAAWDEVRPAGLRHAALLEQANGEVWFGTVEGLYRPNQTNWLVLAGTGIDKAHDVRCLKAASDGSLWVGSGNGLFMLKPRTVRMFAAGESKRYQTVTALLPKEGGGFWAGVDGQGLLSGQAGRFRPFVTTQPDMPGGATVSALCMARDGSLWIGTREDHLWQVAADGMVRQRRSRAGYASRDVTAVAQTSDRTLWAGTREGLLRIDSLKWLEAVGAPEDTILALCADSDGSLWVGTQNSGLWRIASGVGKQVLTKAGGLPSDTIRVLHCDGKGLLWLATPKGLAVVFNRLSPQPSVACFTREQGLPSDDIWQLLDDGSGNLWVGTRRSILMVAKTELMAVAAERKTVLAVRAIAAGDGLEGELTGGDHSGPLAVRTADGRLWFATHAGVALIDPAGLNDDLFIPPVYIEELTAKDGRSGLHRRLSSFDAPGKVLQEASLSMVTLPAGSRDITFRFTAPEFTSAERVLFRTRLDGYDSEWSKPTTERRAVFPKLPSGNYRFRVTVSRPTGGWSESDQSVLFKVCPFFWQTAWFISLSGLSALAAAGAAVGFWVRRSAKRKLAVERRQALERERVMAREQAVERERTRIARDIHDDLGAGLTQVALQSELGQSQIDQPEQVRLRLDQIFQTASGLAQGLNEIVWAVNPKNDTLDSMLTYLGNYVDEYLRAANLRFRVDLPDEYPDLPVSSAIRHHLFCIVREALHNAVKHAAPCEMLFRMNVSGTLLTVEVSDTGGGFDPCAVTSGDGQHNGLDNMRCRMDEVGGRFDIDTAPGCGTRLVFSVELGERGGAS